MKAIIIEPSRGGWEISVITGLPNNMDEAEEWAESEISNNGEYFLVDDDKDIDVKYKKCDVDADCIVDDESKPKVKL